MNQQIVILAIIALVIVSLSLVSWITILKKNNKELAKEMLRLRETGNESYIKFITESRDWAFQYIEEVQGKLKTFSEEIEPQLNYFNTYGRAVPSHNDIALDVITKAFGELKTLLPEENKEK